MDPANLMVFTGIIWEALPGTVVFVFYIIFILFLPPPNLLKWPHVDINCVFLLLISLPLCSS